MADGMVQLADLPGGSVESFVDGVSSDGSALVGWSSGASGVEATLWVGLGAPQGLGDLPNGDFESYAYAVSLGGKRVVGESHTTGGYRAFLWDQVNGMRALGDVLSGLGVDMTGWTLDVAYAISPNGRWVVGTGETPQGNREGFIADLPEPGGATSALAALLALGALAARRRSRGRGARVTRGFGRASRHQRRHASTS
jgi:MYXO-CTERM domain-containing protein